MKKITATMVIAIAAGVVLAGVAVMGTFNENDFTKAEFKAQAGDLANPSTFGLLDLKGHVTLVVRDGFGNIKDYREFDNTIFDVGRECLGELISGATVAGCTGGATDLFNRITVSDCDDTEFGSTATACPVYGTNPAASDAAPTLDNAEVTGALGDVTKSCTATYDTANKRIECVATFFSATHPTTPDTALESPVRASGYVATGVAEILAIQTTGDVTLTGSDTLQITWRIGL